MSEQTPDTWPDPALEQQMLADAEEVYTWSPDGTIPADLAVHVKALLERVRTLEMERDRLRAELASSICHGQSWKNLCEKYKEVAEARGEALDLQRERRESAMSELTTPDTPATPPLDLAALLELAAKVTSAPWILDIRVGSVNVFAGEPPDCLLHECPAVIYRKQGEWTDGGWKTDPQAEADAAFIAAARTALPALVQRVQESEAERDKLRAAITEHHAQKADDRCIEDDDRLYAAAGLPPCDRRVGSKEAMLENCKRFIEQRCQGGGWRTYAELEAENARLRAALSKHHGLHIALAQWLDAFPSSFLRKLASECWEAMDTALKDDD